jgi:hypothetical protein
LDERIKTRNQGNFSKIAFKAMYRVLVEGSTEKDIGKLPADKAAQAPSMKKAQELAPRYRTTLLKA